MKKQYLRVRVALLTFTLGLASVNFFNWANDYWNEIPVDLPKVESESPIIVLPRKHSEPPFCWHGNCGGGGSGGHNYLIEETKNSKKVTNKKLHSSNENGRKSN